MSKPCCGSSPSIIIDGKWSCSDCGSHTENETQLDFFDPNPYVNNSSKKKCECGADATYGKGNGMHSAIMPCPLYKKE